MRPLKFIEFLMGLAAGVRLGVYEILSLVGAGGMGEVYRARDTKLGREVAIKVLPDSVAADIERLARFEREGRTLAALNHPNIAHIHGFEDSTGTPALVMELVDGPTLADRIAKGPLALDEALTIAKQIAEGLEAAHEQGIIHRDLKPANIKVREDGTVKLLDFGLAKLVATDGASAGVGVSQSPTLTTPAGTIVGTILGTAAYMSPEQARGKTVDKRSDIWAFGCVLFEMLTGRVAFAGDTVSDVVAAILGREPDWSLLPGATPPAVHTLLRRCLAKDRSMRLRDSGDARLELQNGGDAPDTRSPSRVPWGAFIGVAVVALAMGAATRFIGRPDTRTPHVARFTLAPSEGQNFTPGGGGLSIELAFSPDGRQLAVASVEGIRLRSLDALETRVLPATDNASSPAFSPDGQSVVFAANGALKTLKLAGGAPITLPGTPTLPSEADWGADGIAFTGSRGTDGVYFAPADGGAVQRITTPDAAHGELHNWPHLLRDPDKVLFTVTTDNSRAAVASRRTGTWQVLEALGEAYGARYVDPGYLVFHRGTQVLAARFDASGLRVVGAPFVVATGANRVAGVAISQTGSLAYLGAQLNTLVWVDRQGHEVGAITSIESSTHPRLSPDGHRLAVMSDVPSNLWVVDLDRGGRVKVTTTQSADPTWHPDGKRIAFRSMGQGQGDLYMVPADGSEPPKLLLSRPGGQSPFSWSPDGRVLAFAELNPQTGWDLWSTTDTGEAHPLLATRANENVPEFSPDGHWLAYVSDESGRREVLVRPFPSLNQKFAISTEGGAEPIWRRDGKELFYRNRDTVMSVMIDTSSGFTASSPHALFSGSYASASETGDPHFEAAADGQRFVMVKPDRSGSQIVVVLDWVEELKARALNKP